MATFRDHFLTITSARKGNSKKQQILAAAVTCNLLPSF
jgi:hypothetical protein